MVSRLPLTVTLLLRPLLIGRLSEAASASASSYVADLARPPDSRAALEAWPLLCLEPALAASCAWHQT